MKNVTPNVQASDAVLKPKLLDQLKRCIRDKYYSIRTEEAYVYYWGSLQKTEKIVR